MAASCAGMGALVDLDTQASENGANMLAEPHRVIANSPTETE